MCEVKVQGNVKLVILRSTYKVENLTLYPLELTLVDETGQPVYAVEKIGKRAGNLGCDLMLTCVTSPWTGLCTAARRCEPMPSASAARP